MTRKAIYPGTFDPITNGHLDVLERALTMFDEVRLLVAKNSAKTPMFSEDERLSMIRQATQHLPNVSAESFQGLTVDYAQEYGAVAIIRGLRAVSDFEYEFQIALMNRKIAPSITTAFLMPHEKYTYLNSSIIRELARHGQDVRCFVPDVVAKALEEKYPLR
ncbi:MAG: pantetheine-phosphate adenylyltransferase [Flammeovirgaceae bacterium]|nr:pantetheine-phosphate adenylyltransferase [Flammeovirgaceae bacterium]MDW8221206.1 pantetheine-phosphate adenylyltransferase [Bacteroidota bacterium]